MIRQWFLPIDYVYIGLMEKFTVGSWDIEFEHAI